MREEIIGDCTLYLASCEDVLPTLGKVDAVVTDPPFELEAHTLQRREKRNGSCENEALPFAAITEETRIEVGRILPVLCSGWLLAFCQIEALVKWKESVEAGGAKYKRACLWIKPDGMPQYSGDRPGMGYETIMAAWCGEGKSIWNGGGKHGVFTFNKNDNGGQAAPHPTTKPLPLMRELVSLFTQPNDLVLDCFMGSGTTGVACVKMGRKFIGIEREPEYFEIACKRIREAYAQPDMFIQTEKKMEQVQFILDTTETA